MPTYFDLYPGDTKKRQTTGCYNSVKTVIFTHLKCHQNYTGHSFDVSNKYKF